MRRKQSSARLFYILMCVSTFVLALFLGGKVPYGALTALILVFPLALLLAWIPGRQLLARHKLDRDVCPRSTEVRYTFSVRNKGLIPAAWTRFEVNATHELPDKPDAFEMPFGPFQSFQWDVTFSPPHRGVYLLTVSGFRVTDPFCLVTKTVTRSRGASPDTLTLTVLPKRVPIPDSWKERLSPQGTGGLFAQSSDEPAVDSRLYRYGDSPRRIHWKLTARQRELMVRQYESLETRRLLVVLDLQPFEAEARADCEDALIESCLSVVHYALERQIDTTLVYGQNGELRRFTGRDLRFFDDLCYEMAAAQFNSRLTLPELLIPEAHMFYLFSVDMPQDLSELPQDRPVDIAVIRGFDGETGGTAQQLLRVTVLQP
ncbi:MAG: DUF58 domain-containing protein [Oscillospiraceae bacterium]|jgi:uncharacterized protein (DUF58 family)|nr:DUF58 domain-containing protein [Oscillospiraceae bacterium]